VKVVVVILVIVAMICLVTSRLRRHRARRGKGPIRPGVPRFLHCRKQEAGLRQAWELVQTIIEDRSDPTAHLAAGVILQPGEVAWARVRARLAVRSSQDIWTAYTRVRWLGRRARNVTRKTTSERWQFHGQIDWLITSQRLVGRLPASGEMYSIWWSGLAGVDIDLESDRIVFNGVNGWIGMLRGPAGAPIAVAAVAMCHGVEALLVHPALHALRRRDPWQPDLTEHPEAACSGGMIVRLPTRRPVA
jgi:hypothetical protein